VEQVREAGLVLTIEREGIVRPLPAGLDLAAFRIVQEGLTNVLKHAGTTTARVCLRYAARELVVRISDEGHGAAARLTESESTGHGLIGMRERVALYGGTLVAGPVPGGGWDVEARLPIGPGRADDDHGSEVRGGDGDGGAEGDGAEGGDAGGGEGGGARASTAPWSPRLLPSTGAIDPSIAAGGVGPASEPTDGTGTAPGPANGAVLA
jgi:hypothetical protein